MRCLPVSVCLSLVGVAACVESSDEPIVDLIEQAICTIAECGTNSPVIDTIGFHELNEDTAVENAQGFKVVDLWHNNQSYALDVASGKITGKLGNVVALQGAALQFAQIRVQRGTTLYGIRIASVHSVQMFARLNNVPKFIEAYNLDYRDLTKPPSTSGPPFAKLCSDIRARRDALGLPKELSVVFEGERIDEATKTIGPVLDNRRFNIACSGHALAKMVMSAQTEAAHLAHAFNTTIPERQAFLKMVTGDYCGTGTPFTVSGQLLQWKDAKTYMPYKSAPASIEARWSANGATCINTLVNGLRINAHHTPLGDATFGGDVRDDVAAECAISACSDPSPHNLNGAFFVSANPP